MSIKPMLLVDIDDVILDTRSVLESWINENLNLFNLTEEVQLRPEEDWENPVMWGVPENEKEETFWQLIGLFGESIKNPFSMIDGADIAIDKLSRLYRIAFLTSRLEEFREDTEKQLTTVLGKERVSNIKVYYNGVSGRTKGDLIKKLDESNEGPVWGLIDNQKRHVDSVTKCGYKGIVFGPQGVNSWADVVQELEAGNI